MSVKIYEAYRLPCANFVELNQFCNHIKEETRKLQQDKVNEDVARRATALYDLKTAGHLEEDIPTFPMHAWSKVHREHMEDRKQDRLGEYDFEICMMPDVDYVYMVPFSGTEAYLEPLRNYPGIEEFGYWNNTDRPDHLTDEEWDYRAQVWDYLMPRSETFKSAGIVLSPFTFFPLYEKEGMEAAIPDFEERLRMASEHIMLKKAPDFRVFDENNKPVDFSFHKLLEWKRDPETKAEKARLKEDLKTKLKPNLKVSDMQSD